MLHTATALLFFVPVALGAALACVALRPGWARPWQLHAARAIVLGTTAACFAAATAHLMRTS